MDGRRSTLALVLLGLATLPRPTSAQEINLEKLGKEALKGIVVGAAVKATAGQLNDLVNAASGKHGGKIAETTRVVPIVSVGEGGYAGAAQVAGPKDAVARVKAVVQLESQKKLGAHLWRVRALVPSSSVNPGELKRVDKVGLTALLDVSLDGRPSSGRAMRGLHSKDLLRGAILLGMVNANRRSLDDFAREVTLARGTAPTRAVISGSLGDRAYVGAAQLAGSAKVLPKVNALWQWDDTLDRGRIRVRYLVPSDSTNPLKVRRLDGVGLTALLETSALSVSFGQPLQRGVSRVPIGTKAREREHD
jgi:hypothetical protein